MAQMLSDQYKSVFSTPKEDFSDFYLPTYDFDSLDDIEITEDWIRELGRVREMNCMSAPGPDGIPAFIYKDHIDQLVRPMTRLWRIWQVTGRECTCVDNYYFEKLG